MPRREAGVTPRRYLVELRTDNAAEDTLGQDVAKHLGRARLVAPAANTTPFTSIPTLAVSESFCL